MTKEKQLESLQAIIEGTIAEPAAVRATLREVFESMLAEVMTQTPPTLATWSDLVAGLRLLGVDQLPIGK